MLCLFVRVPQSTPHRHTTQTDRQTDVPSAAALDSTRPHRSLPGVPSDLDGTTNRRRVHQQLLFPPYSTTREPPHTHTCAVQQPKPRRLVLTRLLHTLPSTPLVDTLHRGHGLALGLVEGGANDAAVRQVDLAVGLLLPAERVLHPVLVVAVGVVLAGVGAARLLPVGGGDGRLGAVFPSC